MLLVITKTRSSCQKPEIKLCNYKIHKAMLQRTPCAFDVHPTEPHLALIGTVPSVRTETLRVRLGLLYLFLHTVEGRDAASDRSQREGVCEALQTPQNVCLQPFGTHFEAQICCKYSSQQNEDERCHWFIGLLIDERLGWESGDNDIDSKNTSLKKLNCDR